MELTEAMIRHYGLTESDLNIVKGGFVPEITNTGDYFVKQGVISNKLGFVIKGLFRSFIYNDEGSEVTTQFFPPGSLLLSSESFNNQTPSKENIVAITDSEILVINYQNMKEVYLKVPVWNQVCKDMADRKSNEMIARTVQFQTLSATERYRQFCKQNPEVVKNAALGHIASYLGIDIATLSRIRKKK